jgi:methyltransferase of ATP-grasp peptide maturase system
MSEHARLHEQLIGGLVATGAVRTEAWRRAAEQVPRHEFVRGGFFRLVPGSRPSAWEPVLEGDAGWLKGCYADESLVTQIAGSIVPADLRGQIMRGPTSSSTLPSLVLRMLEDADVEDGARVLEIGTGTGYSTAVLCARLGEDNVTSVEYDPEVAARAQTALARFLVHPTLVTGDGLRGYPEGALYDRIIATCAVRTVPAAWIEQTRPGGKILTTIGGWLGASELARLTVGEDGTASGPLLGGQVSFMLARPHLPPPLGLLPDLTSGVERRARIGGDVLDDWAARFIVQAAVPDAQRLNIEVEGQAQTVLVDEASGSYAALYEEGGHWVVRQDGSAVLWDAVEEQLGRWRAAGSPGLEKITVHVGPDAQTISW